MRVLSLLVASLSSSILLFAPALRAQEKGLPENDPKARALYDRMAQAMRGAETLSWTSHYRWTGENGKELGRCRYDIWLKKPNYFLLETTTKDGLGGGTLVGDGKWMWLYWPGKRPFFHTEDRADYLQSSTDVYMKEWCANGRHSIAHRTDRLGVGMSMTILDPSTFHGYTDSLQKHIDAVEGLGTDAVRGEDCDVIRLHLLKGQRIWKLWLSRQDHLPRRLRQIVRVRYDIVTEEEWSDVRVGEDIPDERFDWSPPPGWKPWTMPRHQDLLLKRGTRAPDFELMGADGKKIKLSALRGKVVLLNIWRAG